MHLRLREERLRRHYSMRAMAVLLGTTTNRVWRLESLLQPLYLHELERFCQCLQLHPNDLVIYEGVPDPRHCPCCCHQAPRDRA
jgi:transcriptional regulator with XRE-family HTH domain